MERIQGQGERERERVLIQNGKEFVNENWIDYHLSHNVFFCVCAPPRTPKLEHRVCTRQVAVSIGRSNIKVEVSELHLLRVKICLASSIRR